MSADNELLKCIIPFCREFHDTYYSGREFENLLRLCIKSEEEKKTAIVSGPPNNSLLIINS